MENKTYLSIVIPCYNESENLKRGVLEEVENFLKGQDFAWEVIISDDESTDDSRKLVKEFTSNKKNFIQLENKHGGKPFAVKSGIESTKGEWVLLTDMDQATPVDQLKKLLPFFKTHDVIVGSRGMARKNSPLYRKISSALFSNFRRLMLLNNIKDTQCGFKAFKRKVILDLFPKLEVFKVKGEVKGWRVSAYDVELLFIAEKNGYKIKEVPVVWRDTDISKGKQRSFFKESREMLKEIIRVRFNDWKGLYNK